MIGDNLRKTGFEELECGLGVGAVVENVPGSVLKNQGTFPGDGGDSCSLDGSVAYRKPPVSPDQYDRHVFDNRFRIEREFQKTVVGADMPLEADRDG